jgi:antitoxin (DNA-binding transcriptional repressor) of toxin-antitoxin stability system
MTTITVDDIQSDFLGYLQMVQAGETLLITQADLPVAEIKPVTLAEAEHGKQPRPIGLYAGQFVVPDAFDDPLPDELLRLFEGE